MWRQVRPIEIRKQDRSEILSYFQRDCNVTGHLSSLAYHRVTALKECPDIGWTCLFCLFNPDISVCILFQARAPFHHGVAWKAARTLQLGWPDGEQSRGGHRWCADDINTFACNFMNCNFRLQFHELKKFKHTPLHAATKWVGEKHRSFRKAASEDKLYGPI